MSVIQKIFAGKNDGEVHSDFIKYSRGVFEAKYLISAKKQKDRWNIKTGPEFANFLVRECLKEVKGEMEVRGAIIATFDVSKETGFPVVRIKQFMGIKQAIIETKTTPDKIISLMDKFPRAFFALSFSTPNSELKIKAKAPKSAKPATAGGKEPVAEFCSIKTTNQKIADTLLFDLPAFDEVTISHTLNIKEIVLPKNEKDPVKIREGAIRKGTIKRIIKIGEKAHEKEINFEA
jgi:hypothetical protein